eukprot:9766422-Ditylum_brightwellii.AAC.1
MMPRSKSLAEERRKVSFKQGTNDEDNDASGQSVHSSESIDIVINDKEGEIIVTPTNSVESIEEEEGEEIIDAFSNSLEWTIFWSRLALVAVMG